MSGGLGFLWGDYPAYGVFWVILLDILVLPIHYLNSMDTLKKVHPAIIASVSLLVVLGFVYSFFFLAPRGLLGHRLALLAAVVTGTTPGTPRIISATAISCNQVRIVWTPVSGSGSGVRSYTLYKQNPGGASGEIATLSSSVTAYVDTRIASSTTYTYSVTAANREGVSSSVSAPVQVTTPPCVTTSSQFKLSVLGTTPKNVVLSWLPVAGATGYSVLRDGTPIASNLTTTLYGDTTLANEAGTPSRTYQVKAQRADGSTLTSNTAKAQKSADTPIRGTAGDLWADLVLGQSNYGSVSYEAQPLSVSMPGGVAVYRGGGPGKDRIFIADANSNRILGFTTAASGSYINNSGPKSLMGQPNYRSNRCNSDTTTPTNPNAQSLCLVRPSAISTGETVVFANPAVDSLGNLYVPDIGNNRVVAYRVPVSGTYTATAVWGQSGFTTNGANQGGRSMSSLSLQEGNYFNVGIAVDANSNLWVPDFGNQRVQRFPNVPVAGRTPPATISKTANLSLVGPSGTFKPVAVQVDASGNVYVADSSSGNVYQYNASSVASAIAARQSTLIPSKTVVNQLSVSATPRLWNGTTPVPAWFPHSLAIDPIRKGLWIQAGRNMNYDYFYDFTLGKVTKMLGAGSNARGIDVDSAGNLINVSAWEAGAVNYIPKAVVDAAGVLTEADLKVRDYPLDPNAVSIIANFNATGVAHSLSGLFQPTGVTVAGDQLIVTDMMRALYWNNAQNLVNSNPSGGVGRPADGEWNYAAQWFQGFGPVRADASGRIWFSSEKRLAAPNNTCGEYCLYAVKQPLTTNSAVVKSVPLANLSTIDNQPLTVRFSEPFVPFVPIGDGDRVWVGTSNYGVIRVVNIDGKERSGGPYVDAMLAQQNCTSARTKVTGICRVVGLSLDATGNLWVQEQADEYQDGGGTYVALYKAGTIPEYPAHTISSVAPTITSDRDVFTPEVDIAGNKSLVKNPYDSPYVVSGKSVNYVMGGNPDTNFIFGDRVAFANNSAFDLQGNLYVSDFNWNRLLIYKSPFACVTDRSKCLFSPSPSPSIDAITPASTTPRATDLTVTITGNNFLSGSPASTVTVNTVPVSTTYVNPQQLQVVIPAASLSTPRTLSIAVVSVPGGDISNQKVFTVAPPSAAAQAAYDYNGSSTVNNADVNMLTLVATGHAACPAGKTCDLNGDGKVDVKDVLALVALALNGANPYDYNGDRKMDAADTTFLGEVPLGTPCPEGKSCDIDNSGKVEVNDILVLTTLVRQQTTP